MSEPEKGEILVVEDNPASLRLLSEVLGGAGHEVRQAPNGELALWTVQTRPPELILLDVRMPGLDGFEVCRRLKADPAHAAIPVIFLSAESDTAERLQGFKLGAVDFISKPFQPEEVLARCNTHLRLARVQRTLAEERAELELRVAERTADLQLAAMAFENTLDGIIITDADGFILHTNPAFTRSLGYTEEEVRGWMVSDLQADNSYSAQVEAVAESLKATGQWSGEVVARRKNGERCPGLLSMSLARDDTGWRQNYVLVLTDITERKAGQNMIDYLSYHDPLTGLPNRLMARQRFEQMLAKRAPQQRVVVMCLDLDWFKNINDSHGRPLGDKVLQGVARLLAQSAGEGATAARLGGDEFLLILLDDAQFSTALSLVQQLHSGLQHGVTVEGRHIALTASIGIAVAPADGGQLEELVRHGDTAMVRAKETARGSYAFYEESMDAEIHARLAIADQLRGALARNEFTVHYQPQCCLFTGELRGAEALLRWTNPVLRAVPPARFIPLAEQYGLIGPIGEWVLDTVCAQVRKWQDAGDGCLKVAVNLSAVQFDEESTVRMVQAALRRHELPPSCLGIEITEGTVMGDPHKAASALQRLKQLGIHISLDDFGTGYSSLAYLRRLPIDVLKLDKSFVDDVTTKAGDAAIALSVVSLAHNLGMRVIAEGVETREQAAFLKTHGCDEMQGYFYGRPMPAEEFTTLLREKRTLPNL
ncbi:EAL domain-containing protein [Pseudoduganella sp. RAF19]|uniref:EAL domain-containing response regulator n=2 Tax=unclassified Pseudoduganella TaxID=2637179 RepID=UPI003F9462EF